MNSSNSGTARFAPGALDVLDVAESDFTLDRIYIIVKKKITK